MAKRRSYIRSKRGKAPDLGDISFRSSWERNFARILNIWVKEKEIDAWYFEPDEFEFSNIKRGTRYYLPDFKIIEPPLPPSPPSGPPNSINFSLRKLADPAPPFPAFIYIFA